MKSLYIEEDQSVPPGRAERFAMALDGGFYIPGKVVNANLALGPAA